MRITHLCFFVTLCTAAAHAQDMAPPPPAQELQKLAPLVGTWESEGTTMQVPGMPESKWTGTTTYRWVLGGHFMRADTRIDGDGMPGTLQMIEFTGWDRENGRFLNVSVSNMGDVHSAEVVWTSPKTTVQVTTGFQQGQLYVDRWKTEFGDGEMTFSGDRAMGNSAFYSFVVGKSKKTSETPTDIEIQNASFPQMIPVNEHMKKAARMAGTYSFKGSMEMPGMPKTDITAKETMKTLFGGTVMEFDTAGDPIPGWEGDPYQGLGFMGWDDHEKCYAFIGVNSMGEIGPAKGWMVDGKLVMTMEGKMMGQPTVSRYVMELDDSGAITRTYSDSIFGVGAPMRSFEGTYSK